MQATWLPGIGAGEDSFERVFGVRRELYDGYVAFRDAIVRESRLSAGVVSRCAERVEWLLTAVGAEPAARDAGERALFVFVDKFVRDPHAIGDDDVAALRDSRSVAEVVGLTELLALLDGFTRFRLILDAGVPTPALRGND